MFLLKYKKQCFYSKVCVFNKYARYCLFCFCYTYVQMPFSVVMSSAELVNQTTNQIHECGSITPALVVKMK